jgi:hypothetical protein
MKGTRYQVGSSVVSAPIGVAGDGVGQVLAGQREQDAEHGEDHGCDRAAERRPTEHTATGRRPRQVSRVVGRGVGPADAEAGRDQSKAHR